MEVLPLQHQSLQSPMLPCNRVLGIQELQDLIRTRLLFRDLKTCTLVCRYWNSLFEPYLWTTVDLNEHDRGKMAILRRHGSYVVALDFVHADKKSFKFIRQFCPFVQSLSLVFDSRSSWVNYDCLEKFYSRMPQVTTMQIRFDAFQFSPAMFWSLSQLPNLTSLTMDVFYVQYYSSKHYHPDAYMTILDCCPNLDELAVCGLFLEPADTAQFHFKNSFPQWVKKTLRPKRENAPSNTQEAMTSPRHSRSWSSGTTVSRFGRKSKGTAYRESVSESVKDVPAVEDTSSQGPTYTIRKLDLRSPRMDDDVFCRLTSRCTLLEELTLDGVWVRISIESWKILSTKCPRLRSLTVRNSGAVHYLPSVQALMALFPRLESVTMMSLEFNRDPDLSTLAAKTQELERKTRDQHPLKHIHLSGSILKPLKVLLDIVTQSSTVESLSIGFTLNAVRRVDNEPIVQYDLERRWACQDTLAHLDLTSVSFPDKTVFSRFFGHVQRLTRLKSLWISVSHIREAGAITARNRGSTGTCRHSPSSSSQGGSTPYNLPSVSTPSLGNSRPSGSGNIHTSFFCFPALETLRIGIACYLNKKWFEMPVLFDEVVYMIDATPMLRRLELKHSSESGVLKRLSAEYPKIEFS
ncbi:hypothetical protein EDD21DRAFT_368593 [Dissophora ornata]|nr:hypothetical protein BGZ58_003657 [Dissophora ornata]KAI8603616.1 hypothetical protein EDD21DRAFT_368593 [Dissophora ornata]